MSFLSVTAVQVVNYYIMHKLLKLVKNSIQISQDSIALESDIDGHTFM